MRKLLKISVVIYLIALHSFLYISLTRNNFINTLKFKYEHGLHACFDPVLEARLNAQLLLDPVLPQNAIVLIGDSHLSALPAMAGTINLGTPGGSVRDILETISMFHCIKSAATIFIHCGFNSLARRSDNEILKEYLCILQTLPAKATKICSAILPVSAAAFGQSLNKRIANLNIQLRSVCTAQPQTAFIDIGSDLSEDMYLKDGIHLNKNGVAVFTSAIVFSIQKQNHY